MVKASAGGGIAGFIADQLMNTFPLGTLAGTFHKALFSFAAGDMNQAYDPSRATQGSHTQDFGDLKNMASGFFGDLASKVGQFINQGGPQGQPEAQGKSADAGPRTEADARAQARPQVGEEARTGAQSQSGMGGWGKALLYGGLALGGLTLLRDYQMGGFGMPFYGGMSPYMMPGMVPPMPGMFW
ncbi:MAG: hypothetical protein AAF449_04640 [Myxococcota bacterium]